MIQSYGFLKQKQAFFEREVTASSKNMAWATSKIKARIKKTAILLIDNDYFHDYFKWKN
jgi:hypothetical protein